MLKSSFSVKLIGGSSKLEGNVFARNPTTKVFGPVCDDVWTIENVSFKKSAVLYKLNTIVFPFPRTRRINFIFPPKF